MDNENDRQIAAQALIEVMTKAYAGMTELGYAHDEIDRALRHSVTVELKRTGRQRRRRMPAWLR